MPVPIDAVGPADRAEPVAGTRRCRWRTCGTCATTRTMWRISDDLWDRWEDIEAQFARLARWAPHSATGRLGRRRHASARPDRHPRRARRRPVVPPQPAEQRTMMTLWTIARSPLMVGGDLPVIPAHHDRPAHQPRRTRSAVVNKGQPGGTTRRRPHHLDSDLHQAPRHPLRRRLLARPRTTAPDHPPPLDRRNPPRHHHRPLDRHQTLPHPARPHPAPSPPRLPPPPPGPAAVSVVLKATVSTPITKHVL